MASDAAYLKNWMASLKLWHLAAVAAAIVGLYYLQNLSGLGGSDVDRTDYKAVAMYFVMDNPTIASKLGKVTSTSFIGAGGGAGKTSYNALSIKGETKSGVCYVTLNKNEEGLWFVKTATLMTQGAEYTIPVSRQEEKRTLKWLN